MIPDKAHRSRDNRDRDVEEDYAERNGEVQEKRDQPPEIIAMQDEASNPPAREG